jgi:hypothetical protein
MPLLPATGVGLDLGLGWVVMVALREAGEGVTVEAVDFDVVGAVGAFSSAKAAGSTAEPEGLLLVDVQFPIWWWE